MQICLVLQVLLSVSIDTATRLTPRVILEIRLVRSGDERQFANASCRALTYNGDQTCWPTGEEQDLY